MNDNDSEKHRFYNSDFYNYTPYKKGWSLLSTQEFKVSAAALGNDYLSIYIKL